MRIKVTAQSPVETECDSWAFPPKSVRGRAAQGCWCSRWHGRDVPSTSVILHKLQPASAFRKCRTWLCCSQSAQLRSWMLLGCSAPCRAPVPAARRRPPALRCPKSLGFVFPWRCERAQIAPLRFAKAEALKMAVLHPAAPEERLFTRWSFKWGTSSLLWLF